MAWKPPEIWKGGRCFIIGGGHSVYRQFEMPEELINKVLNKQEYISAFSPYMKALHDKHVIGVNQAFRLGGWVDMTFIGDPGFLKENKDCLWDWKNLKVHCAPKMEEYYYWIKKMDRNRKQKHGICSKPGLVSWNGNSGAAAISLAVQLGVKQIILLGFDMNKTEQGTHWHNLYNERGDIQVRKTFQRYMGSFPAIQKDAEKLGVEILNASPESSIEVFPKINVKDII